MSYCLGIKLKEGLVGIADTRISAGSSTTVKKKVFVQQTDGSCLFIMTSGLRSVRDKAVHYFQELISEGIVYDKLYKAVNGFGEQMKRVAIEDNEALVKSGYKFDLNAIVTPRSFLRSESRSKYQRIALFKAKNDGPRLSTGHLLYQHEFASGEIRVWSAQKKHCLHGEINVAI